MSTDPGILIRVSHAEKEAYVKAAKLDDRPVSSWLRTLARQKLSELGIEFVEESEPIAKKRTKKEKAA